VFGLDEGTELDQLRDALTGVLAFAENPLSVIPSLREKLRWWGPVREFERAAKRTDELVYAVIEQRRAAAGDESRDDVLAMLLQARHDDGTEMTPEELRDELMTALVAGHETTASELAWAFERLAREPRVTARLAQELDAGEGDEYLTATIHEIMRLRPVLPNAEPRLVKEPIEIGGIRYPAGVALLACAFLVHHDPDIYPEPLAFRPERFIGEGNAPGTYTWLPFGGGRRRCIGASFAIQEMKVVIRSVLGSCELTPAGERPEQTARRSITFSPAGGASLVLHDRAAVATSTPDGALVTV
jgi:hypothetical protein